MAFSCSSFLAQYLASSSGISAAQNTNSTSNTVSCVEGILDTVASAEGHSALAVEIIIMLIS